MIFFSRIEKWSSSHHPRWMVFIRLVLGICLFAKGISFMQDTEALQQIIASSKLNTAANAALAQAITWIHLLGGFLIIIGLFTRFAVSVQIPILLGAIIFINSREGIISVGSELGFALLILVLLIIFLIEGSGPISLDNYFRNYYKINKEN